MMESEGPESEIFMDGIIAFVGAAGDHFWAMTQNEKSHTLPATPVLAFLLSLLLLVIFFAGFVLRFWDLGAKPIHHDEAVNAWLTAEAWTRGFINYDPTNYHGVLLFLIYQFAELISGPSVIAYRMVTSLAGAFSVGFFLLLAYQRKSTGLVWAALALLMSPAFFFFSRSAIHEAVFVFFQILFVWGLLQAVSFFEVQKDLAKIRMALSLAAAGLLGMMLLKETFVLLGVATAAALIPELILNRQKWLKHGARVPFEFWFRPIFLFLLGWVVLQSGFLQNVEDLFDFVKAFLPWLKTGTDQSGHAKPFYFWLKLVWDYEPVLLLAMVCSAISIFSKDQLLRISSRLAVLHLLIYSLIPYKTVWCSISIFWPFLLVFGLWWDRVKLLPPGARQLIHLVLPLFVLGGIAYQFRQYQTLLYGDYKSTSHRYLYVETSPEIINLWKKLEVKLNEAPLLKSEQLVWQAKEVWPLPWLTHEIKNQGYVKELTDELSKAHFIFAEIEEFNRKRSLFAETHDFQEVQLRAEGPRLAVGLRKEIGIIGSER